MVPTLRLRGSLHLPAEIVGVSCVRSCACAVPLAPERSRIGIFHCSEDESVPRSRKRCCCSATLRLPCASQLAVADTSGNPGCWIQLDAIAPTSRPLAALSAFQRSVLVALE